MTESEANTACSMVFLTTGILLDVGQSGDRGRPWMVSDPGEFELHSLVEVAEFITQNIEHCL